MSSTRVVRPSLWLIRHGETVWSAAGKHTGRTDVPLTPRGERQAAALREPLAKHTFGMVLTSPLRRARDTARIAGFGDRALADDDLQEWDYGQYEGRTTSEIRAEDPHWTLFGATIPAGETADQVGTRADRVIARALAFDAARAAGAEGDVAIFAHGHLLKILAARWLGLPASTGRYFALDTASISILGSEHDDPVIERWNDVHYPESA